MYDPTWHTLHATSATGGVHWWCSLLVLRPSFTGPPQHQSVAPNQVPVECPCEEQTNRVATKLLPTTFARSTVWGGKNNRRMSFGENVYKQQEFLA
eukprot:5969714-Amphidinium_carterae.1